MPQIDAILKFTDLATALVDPIVQQHVSTDAQGNPIFAGDHVIPDLKVWRNSQDTTQTVTGPGGQQYQQTVHNYLTGYYALISMPRVVLSLRDHSALQVVITRDNNTVLKRNVTFALLNDLRFEPIYAGCNYPWGAWG